MVVCAVIRNAQSITDVCGQNAVTAVLMLRRRILSPDMHCIRYSLCRKWDMMQNGIK